MLCHSDTALRTGLRNECPTELLGNLQRLSGLLGDIQDALGEYYPLKVTSGFRSLELNAAVGGVSNSQHCLGLAADIVCAELGSAWHLATMIDNLHLPFDQLILEYNRWVHVSVAPDGQEPRRQRLSIFGRSEGYLDGLIRRE